MSQIYKIPSYQSIMDAASFNQLPLDNIVSFLKQSDLDFNSDLSGANLIYEESQVFAPTGGQPATFTSPATASYVTNSTQNLYDIALMTLGDLNKIVLLISSNEIFNSINDAPDGVKQVNYNVSDITDAGFKLALKKSNINITTGAFGFSGVLGTEAYDYLLTEDGNYILI